MPDCFFVITSFISLIKYKLAVICIAVNLHYLCRLFKREWCFMDNSNAKRSRSNEIDMLNGPLFRKILFMALPLAASSFLQELFNSIDIAVVGHFVGSNALAAVGSNAPVIGLLINLFVGISMGACAIISNHIGQRDEKSIRNAIKTVTLVALISGIFLLFLGQVVARPILTWMGTPPEVLGEAVTYLRIYFLGMPFIMTFNFGAAILRSIGDTRRPLYILIFAGCINTSLNFLFVLCFNLGVAGVAIATGIANMVSASIIVWLLMREREPYRLSFREMKIYRHELKKMLGIGVPAGIQSMIFSISNVIVQSSINSYGADAIAGSAAAVNFEYYCYFIIQGFNGAAISFIAQNYGAGKMDRVHRIFRICMFSGIVSCALFNGLFVWQDDFFLGLFTDMASVRQYGSIRMHIVLLPQFIACSYEIAGSCMRGMGKSLTPAILTVFGTCLLRIVWVYVVSPLYPGFDFLLTVYPLSWVLTGSMVLTAYWMTVHRRIAD